MFYLYRFLNSRGTVIYVGKTNNLEQRLRQHNHLPQSCYKSIKRIEYAEFENESDQIVYEVFYINSLKPRYNKDAKGKDVLTISLEDVEWKGFDSFANADLSYFTSRNESKLNLEVCLNEYIENQTIAYSKDEIVLSKVSKIIKKDGFYVVYNAFGYECAYLKMMDVAIRAIVDSYNSKVQTANELLAENKFNKIILDDFEG